jgi:hypothetical protein
LRRGFPSFARVRKEARSARTVLGQHFVQAVSIKADGRRADEDLRFAFQKVGGKSFRRLYSTFVDASLLLPSPAPLRNAFSGQVNDSVKSTPLIQATLIDFARFDIPGDGSGFSGSSRERSDFMSSGKQPRSKRSTNKARRT